MARDQNCPARSKKCKTYGEIGHFAVCSTTKELKPFARDDERRNNTRERAYQLSEDSAPGQQDYYAFAVGVGQPTSCSEVDLRIGGVMLPAVLIDSGASCNVINQATWEVLKESVQCQSKKSSKRLFAYGQKDHIEVIGTFVSEIVCEISGISCVDEFTVVKGPGRPLFGKNTAETNYQRIQPLANKIIMHLQLELISLQVTDGDIRICVDMRRANSAIERERYPIPTIEEILYDLNGSTVFSKLDIKWDFHQVELGERSREIPTFVTHLGLYRLNQCEPKDSSGEEFDFVKAVAEESLPVALTAKQVKRASDSDPELASLRQHILSGDWSQSANRVVGVPTQIFSSYGFPFTLKSDNGTQFCCEEFEKFLSDHGIEHLTSPPLLPQANGHVERQNRTLLKSLKVAHVHGKNWREELQKFLYRSTPQTSIGVTSPFLMFGRELKTKLAELRCANTKTSGKLEENFESEPYTMQTKEGSRSEVTVRSKEDVEYRRNRALVKRYNPPGELPEATEAISQHASNTLPHEENKATSRPRRIDCQNPGKYKDYVLYELNSVDTLDLC
ncbi:Uncharacterized protein K02A2.6 [Stylophora pistillata]|uniref:Uncharacterized protein K02A2.6 n=1 Tax=Stylophora pistillata TaxID=50429 RepID=A0A2B4R7B1_STYPI|nr:Uncharacterized protein K02A2.6 [Stylophora pistillata]